MDAKSALQIGLAIGVLLSIFAAYLSSKTWSVGQVVLVVFVFLSTCAFWYLSAATLKTHKVYREELGRLKAEAERLEGMNRALQAGTTDPKILQDLQADEITLSAGIDELEREIHRMTLDRGRVWRDTQPENVAAGGTAQISIEEPSPHNIAAQTVLYVFEEATDDNPGQYLGEFKVTATGDGTITIEPLQKLDQVSQERLANSPGPWALYDTMPIDRHDVFADLEEDELRALLPEESLEEYLRHGTEAQADDPPERVVGYKRDGTVAGPDEQDRVEQRRYQRELRAYELLFRQLHRDQFVAIDAMERLTRDKALLEDALAKAQMDVEYREEEKQKLEADLAQFKKEYEVVAAHAQKLEALLAALKARVGKLRQDNAQLAASIAQRQLQLAAEIDQRTEPEPAEGATDLGREVGTVAP